MNDVLMFSLPFFTCHVLILAAFWVPVKVQLLTCISSTVLYAPSFPRLPMLHTMTYRERKVFDQKFQNSSEIQLDSDEVEYSFG